MDKIVCFGKNYQDHMLELGDAPVDRPVIFLKPFSVLKQCQKWGDTLELSLTPEETHFECELVLKLKKGGYNLTTKEAWDSIEGFTIGLDMTLRQKQASLKKNGHPWTTAKVFPDSAIIGPWISAENTEFLKLPFNFVLDDEVRQESTGEHMLFKPVDLVQYASQHFPLCAGDILFTGTPSGVGAVKKGSLGRLNLADNSFCVKWD